MHLKNQDEMIEEKIRKTTRTSIDFFQKTNLKPISKYQSNLNNSIIDDTSNANLAYPPLIKSNGVGVEIPSSKIVTFKKENRFNVSNEKILSAE